MSMTIKGFYSYGFYKGFQPRIFAPNLKTNLKTFEMSLFNIIKIKRKTTQESRFHPRMGALSARVTRIQQTLFGFPVRTLYTYRETYHGKIKDLADCNLSMV